MTTWPRTIETCFVTLNQWAVILALAAMSCIVFANVTLRYLTNDSIVWAEEVSRYLMIYMAFLSAGLALRAGLLVAVSERPKQQTPFGMLLRWFILLSILVFCGWMIHSGYDYMQRMGRQLTPATRISFKYVYAAMPIGFGLLMIHTLLAAPRFLSSARFDTSEAEPLASAVSS